MASLWDTLLGNAAADTSKQAALDTYQKQLAAGQAANSAYQGIAKNYDPYARLGLGGVNALENLASNPESVRSLPGYEFARQEGLRAVDRLRNAGHSFQSGSTLKGAERYATGLADQTYGNQFNRLLQLTGQGQQATGAQAGLLGQGANEQFQSAYGGAGTIGQGDVAGAQAQQQGIGNLLGAATYLGGSFLGSKPFDKGLSYLGNKFFGPQ